MIVLLTCYLLFLMHLLGKSWERWMQRGIGKSIAYNSMQLQQSTPQGKGENG